MGKIRFFYTVALGIFWEIIYVFVIMVTGTLVILLLGLIK
jgi:hypothetical protein